MSYNTKTFTESLAEFIEEELGYGTHVSEHDGEVTPIIDDSEFSFRWDCVQENTDNPVFWDWVEEQIESVTIETSMDQTYLSIYRTLADKIRADITPIKDAKPVWEGIALVFGLLEV